jgi:transposase InsO family protein
MIRAAFVREHSGLFCVGRMCRLVGISRSHYYQLLEDQGCTTESALEKEVKRIFTEHSRRYGSRRIVAELQGSGWSVGREKVASVMRKHGLQAIQPRSYVPKTTQSPADLRRSPNLLLGLGEPSRPDQVWVGDITYLPLVGGGWLYMGNWMDLYSRAVVGWKVAEHMQEELVINALQIGIGRRRPPNGLIVHSDGGGQFGANAFRALLQGRFRQSMTRKDNHYDNAHAESLYSRFKAELLEGGAFLSLEDAQKECFAYIEEYYNRKRRHSALGYLSPTGFEEQYRKRLADGKP